RAGWVGGKEHDVMRVLGGACERSVGNQVDRVCRPGVLCPRLRVVIGNPWAGVVDLGLEDRAEAFGRGVDLRFGLLVDPDRLGVTATLEVKDAAVTPSVLVVADEAPRRFGRQGRLTRAAQPEEERDIIPRGVG